MAKHEITIRENTAAATKEAAPFLGTYQSKGVKYTGSLWEDIAAEAGLTSTQVEAIFTGAIDAIIEMQKEMPSRIHSDLGTFETNITGSFETADAAFDPDENAFELVLRPTEAMRKLLVNVTPRIVTDQTVTRVRIDQVSDVEKVKPFNVIFGLKPFDIYGMNIGNDDTRVWYETKAGVTYPCTVIEVKSAQWVRARLNAPIPNEGGTGKVYLQTKGGDDEGPTQVDTRNVTYVYEDPSALLPTVTDIRSEGGDTEWDYAFGSNNKLITGTHLVINGAKPTIKTEYMGETMDWTEVAIPADKITVNENGTITVDKSVYADLPEGVNQMRDTVTTIYGSVTSAVFDAYR